ncbi:unnamed protein product [Spodoptera littoralis]|uniref:Uncharacterized protein n=1 Tax=Spodoptera littoralis TaxID=7109 RepID=A0A9P0N0L7_SPOLI|nr:unnamed protein product [Spodoptera littoralis]CAH1640236.1 unnamed protein product [Spodoptera littoralis]
MDSSKDSSSMRNSVKLDGEGENSKDYKETPNPTGPRDSAENLFTSTSNPSSSFVPLNGPQPNHVNSSSNNESTSQTSKCSENIPGTSKALSTSTQPQFCNNKVTNSTPDLPDPAVPGNSRSIPALYDNGTESSQDKQTCQRHKVCLDKAGSSSLPSTSGTSKPSENAECSPFRENRKRPSSLKLNRPNLDEDSSSDTGNDDYSLGSEDGCIYTYRGGEHLADLPSSFFSLDMGLPLDKHLAMPNFPGPPQAAAAGREHGSRASSPDMDFLEMDFDPGPSCEVDTGDESSPDADLESASNMPEENEPVLVRGTSPEYVPPVRYAPVSVPPPIASGSHGDADLYSYSVPSTSRGVGGQGDAPESSSSHNYVDQNYSYGPYITHVNSRGEQLIVRRTMAHGPINFAGSLHFTSGDLVSPSELLCYDDEHVEAFAHQINQSTLDTATLSSALYHVTMAKKLIAEKARCDAENQATAKASEAAASTSTSAACVEPPRCMIWSECEACERQVTQISTSACGATAVVNVFNALGVPVNLEKISSSVGTRQRANTAPLPRYLLSRAVAGCTAADLVSGIHRASDGLVTARFFPTYPERAISLSHWLADWITVGAVPILTLNLQAGYENDIPDAWHHQMVFGVSPRGVYLCNPVECIREATLWQHLTSPSVLLVKTRDVLSRFTADTDLSPLMVVPDRRFHTFNVLGQVINVIREWRAIGWGDYGTRTRHIRIPASYQAGVTVAALTGSEAHRRLTVAPQLPVLTQTDP